ncbi:MAG: zinc protease, partial [Ilumatobacter sp.]
MLGVSRRSVRSRLLGITIVAALAAAACTGSSDATPTTDQGGNEQGGNEQGGAEPTGTEQGGTEGRPRTEIVEPDERALLSLEIDPAIVTGTLDNGLQYFIRENDNPGSRVEMRLTIDAGAAFQTEDQGGGAHFLEHMLFNGTEQFPENELIAVLRSFGAGFGADINAYTSYDETVYELTMPTADPSTVETGLDVLQQWLSAA